MPSTMTPPASCDVYTPPALADAIVRALGDFQTASWLEPCVGKGAFLSALAENGVEPSRVTGTDLASSREPTDRLARVRRSTEFLQWATKTTLRFDRVVANPPFIALSSLPSRIQQSAIQHCTLDGSSISLSGNCWHAFICASLRLLRQNGSIAFVLPAAFEYANYAESLRHQLPTHFADVQIHRCRTPLFQEVEDGSVVVIAKEFRALPKTCRRFMYADFESLVNGIRGNGSVAVDPRTTPFVFNNDNSVALNDVMSVGIGAVTGDAKYFLMNDEIRLQNSLPIEAMVRVVSKSRHVVSDSMTREQWEILRSNGDRVWLFRPSGRTLKLKAVKRYLDKAEGEGGCRKMAYKIRIREPWFQTPMPLHPHGFLTGMSQHGPVICFNRMRGLTATNTLYTVRFASGISREQRRSWGMMFLTSAVRTQLQEKIRSYPLGLSKLEPGDLGFIRIPRPVDTSVPVHVYSSAVNALLKGNRRKSETLAARYIAKPESFAH